MTNRVYPDPAVVAVVRKLFPPPHVRGQIRMRARMSAKQVAEACGVRSHVSVFNWESGLREPYPRNAVPYFKVLRQMAEDWGHPWADHVHRSEAALGLS